MDAQRVLGLDEAGRGSLVGPLVVGGFLTTQDRMDDLVATGAKDSKALRPVARVRILAALESVGSCAHVPLAPRAVDQSVARGELNRLEAATFAGLVRDLAPDIVYLDACDPNERRFGQLVRRLSGARVRVVSRHHADRDFPIVGAASIVAKVRRDEAIARLRSELGDELGSGYPSDERTVRFVRQVLRAGGPVPEWVRASWSTMKRVKARPPARTLDGFAP